MYFEGENIVIVQRHCAIIENQLYMRGSNLVPAILLPDSRGEFGIIDNWTSMHIDRERYYEIALLMRKLIEGDFSYRFFLKKKTLQLLDDFKADTEEFEKRLLDNTIDSDWLEKSLNNYSAMLALLEFNGMIPYNWFDSQLRELNCKDKIKNESFSYIDFESHRIFLYKKKLMLLKELYNTEDFSAMPQIDKFMDEYNYLSDKGSPLTWDFDEKRKELCDELNQLRTIMSIEDIEKELSFIEKRRTETKWQYYENMRVLNTACIEKGYSATQTANMIQAFSIISFTCEEEELRHFLQDRYWVLLNKLFRKLELPPQYVTIESLIEAVKLS